MPLGTPRDRHRGTAVDLSIIPVDVKDLGDTTRQTQGDCRVDIDKPATWFAGGGITRKRAVHDSASSARKSGNGCTRRSMQVTTGSTPWPPKFPTCSSGSREKPAGYGLSCGLSSGSLVISGVRNYLIF